MTVRPLHSAIDKVYRMANLVKASRKVCANQGAPGVDGQTVEAWRANEQAQLRQLHGELYADKYRGKHVRRQYIPKPGSKRMRPLGIPAVKDRVCQQAVLNILQPVFERIFHPGSHGFRPGRSTHTARKAILADRKAGCRFVVEEGHPKLLRRSGSRHPHETRALPGEGASIGPNQRMAKRGGMEEGKVRYQIGGTP